ARAEAALQAGCDMLPVCNNRAGVVEILDGLGKFENPAGQLRLIRMHGRHEVEWESMRKSSEWRHAVNVVTTVDENPELQLDF
ncbi:MAG: beta-N-acetylhexosaminidase, partial [Gammaproteobacteria bacterium]|nr:beta-N-acetylhexosaminidase [Gammaproteobacteria bacterium]